MIPERIIFVSQGITVFEILLSHFNGKNRIHSKCYDVLYFYFILFFASRNKCPLSYSNSHWDEKLHLVLRRTNKNCSKYSILLRCDTATEGNRIQRFRRNVLHLQGSILVGLSHSWRRVATLRRSVGIRLHHDTTTNLGRTESSATPLRTSLNSARIHLTSYKSRQWRGSRTSLRKTCHSRTKIWSG